MDTFNKQMKIFTYANISNKLLPHMKTKVTLHTDQILNYLIDIHKH